MKDKCLYVERKKYSFDTSERTERQLEMLFVCEISVCVLLGQHV